MTPQCVVAWTKQNQNYQAPPPANHIIPGSNPKNPLVSSDEKSVSTTTTQSDLIDNVNLQIQNLKQQISQFQKQLIQPLQGPTHTSTPLPVHPGPFLALEAKLADMVEKHWIHLEILHQQNTKALVSFQTQTTNCMDTLDEILLGQTKTIQDSTAQVQILQYKKVNDIPTTLASRQTTLRHEMNYML